MVFLVLWFYYPIFFNDKDGTDYFTVPYNEGYTVYVDRKKGKIEEVSMSFIKAKEYLKQYGFEDKIMEFSVSSATVEEAARALNCKEERIAKTLSFIVEDKPILIVVAGDSKIDNSKYKAEFHVKARMIPFDQVETSIGHAVGGVCPFGVNEDVSVYLDDSLKRFDVIYPACGSSNSAVKLSLEELIKISNYKKWVDVCKQANSVSDEGNYHD